MYTIFIFLEETRSLIPNLLIAERAPASLINATLTIIGYQGTCSNSTTEFSNCSSVISHSITNFAVGTSISKCKYDPVARLCTVNVICDRCSFLREQAEITIVSNDTSGFASGYVAFVNTSAGIQNAISTISYPIFSDSDKYFRGTHSPTILNLVTVQTIYRRVNTDSFNDTGFHVDFKTVTLGEQVDFRQFNSKSGIRFVFAFSRESNTLEINRTQKKNPISIISELFGGISGFVGFVGIIMRLFERFVENLLCVKLGCRAKRKARNETVAAATDKPGEKKNGPTTLLDFEL